MSDMVQLRVLIFPVQSNWMSPKIAKFPVWVDLVLAKNTECKYQLLWLTFILKFHKKY